jgi:hypothetical protein
MSDKGTGFLLPVTREELVYMRLMVDAAAASESPLFGVEGFVAGDYLIWFFVFHSTIPVFRALGRFLHLGPETVRRKIRWVAKVLSRGMRDLVHLLPDDVWDEHMKQARKNQKKMQNATSFDGLRIYAVDGSSFSLHRTKSIPDQKAAWCWYKHDSQMRLQLVCSLDGFIGWISRTTIGHISDDAALDETGFAGVYNRYYGLVEDPERLTQARVAPGGTGVPRVLLGDKAYVTATPMAMTDIWVTRSAEGTDEWNKVKGRPYVVTSGTVAGARSVVERIFGRVKQDSLFLAGRILNTRTSKTLAKRSLWILCALYNRRYNAGKRLFLREDEDEDEEVEA